MKPVLALIGAGIALVASNALADNFTITTDDYVPYTIVDGKNVSGVVTDIVAAALNEGLVATNDLHYVHAEDADDHDTLLCVSAGSNKDTPGRFKFDGSGYYLKSPAEMRLLFSNLPEACDNTLAIAERCSTDFDEGTGIYMPAFPVPEGETEESWFVKEVDRGLHERFPDGVPEYALSQALPRERAM